MAEVQSVVERVLTLTLTGATHYMYVLVTMMIILPTPATTMIIAHLILAFPPPAAIPILGVLLLFLLPLRPRAPPEAIYLAAMFLLATIVIHLMPTASAVAKSLPKIQP